MNDNLIMFVKFEPKTAKTITTAREDLGVSIKTYQTEHPLFYTITEGAFTFAEVTADDLSF